MSGALGRYFDDFIRLARNADVATDLRAVLNGAMARDIETAIKSADPNVLDDLIRRGADSSDSQVARVFGSDAFKTHLAHSRNRHLFEREFVSVANGQTGAIDLEQMMAKYGLDANDAEVKVAQEYLTANPARKVGANTGTSSTADAGGAGARTAEDAEARFRRLEDELREQRRRTDQFNILNWKGRFNRLVDNVASRAGPFKGVVVVTGKGLIYSTALVGVGGTALTVAGISHLATGGESTRALTGMIDDAAVSLYDTLKDDWPEFADFIKEKSPEATRLLFTAATLDTQMLAASLRELNSRHDTGVSDTDIDALAHVMEGDFVLGALRKAGVDIQGEDVERIMRESMNAPDRKAYIAQEFSRLTGRNQQELLDALASPEVFDATGMTPEQIAEHFGQTVGLDAGTTNDPRTLLQRGQDALRRRSKEAADMARTSVDQASELVRIGRLSGDGLSSEFNRVVQEKDLGWFSSPTMFMIKLMDTIGFDFFGLNDMLKKQVLLDNVKTQFGDQFGVLKNNGAGLDLDHAPAPSS